MINQALNAIKGIKDAIILVCLVTMTLCFVITVATGRSLTLNVEGLGVVELGAFNERISALETALLDIENEYASTKTRLEAQRDLAYIWDQQLILDNASVFQENAVELCERINEMDVSCAGVGIWLVDQRIGHEGKRILLAATPDQYEAYKAKETQAIALNKERGQVFSMPDSYIAGGFEGLVDADEEYINNIPGLTGKIVNLSKHLKNDKNAIAYGWDKSLSNMVTHTAGAIGDKGRAVVVMIAVDYNVASQEEVKQAVKAAVQLTQEYADKIAAYMLELNPSARTLDHLF